MEATLYSKLRVTPAIKTSLAPAMSSWRAMHPEIAALGDSNDSLTKLSQMLAIEIARPDGARAQLLARLHMKINAMRQRMEVAAIEQAAGVVIIKSPPTANPGKRGGAVPAKPAAKASKAKPKAGKRATH